ncbi:Polyisoprenoid-binding protein YceI [Shimia gijangensis]|uniref:Polyisoprenoid-binding protein YceI n=1 Tax=Shimia gijangensis TaxID=1470563 RepID=A0A1M6HHT8_9RHOB|nr:YceI family protein [Shimia gijangensis]SHJ21744.1 Polyisoprenoid-binding protein YceI [Shimia gijangensis]
MIRALFICFLTIFSGTSVGAAPVPYALDVKDSEVVFFYTLGGRENRGAFSVRNASTMIDLQDVRRSSLDVTISTNSVRAGDPFVTLALKGPELLATGKHPEARFVSKRVFPTDLGVRIAGDLTLKGITLPVTLNALFQRRANAPTDNSELILQVTGAVPRASFGVTGFPDLVGDMITLRFVVHLVRE